MALSKDWISRLRGLLTALDVGAVVALSYRAPVNQPQSFLHSRAVSAYVGLTRRRYT